MLLRNRKSMGPPESQKEARPSDASLEVGGFYLSTEPTEDVDDHQHEDIDDDEANDGLRKQSHTDDGREDPNVAEGKRGRDPISSIEGEDAAEKVLGDKDAKRKAKKRKKIRDEKALMSFVFGDDFAEDSNDVLDTQQDHVGPPDQADKPEVSREGDGVHQPTKEDPEKKRKKTHKKKERKPAWKDEDEEETLVKDVTATYRKAPGQHGLKETSEEVYALALKRKFNALVGAPKWANLDRRRTDDANNSDEEFFRETTDMLDTGKRSELQSGRLAYRKLSDLNSTSHAEGTVIRAAEFHPSAAVALVAGVNGTASLFQVDGKQNPKIQTTHFPDFPVRTAHFSSNGGEFIVASNKAKHFYVYDLSKAAASRVEIPRLNLDGQECLQNFEVSDEFVAVLGRFGEVYLLSSRTKEKIFSLKMNDRVFCAAFGPGGRDLYTHGAGGELYLWDVRQSRSCVRRVVDDGCVRGTALAISPDGARVATGADSGVVNLYETRSLHLSTMPKPEKAFMNLTTSVAKLKFNPSSEILAMTSEVRENAIKLAHVPSKTVFCNFPSWNFNLKRVNCIDFSLNGGFMSVGNNRGAANLYRLNHDGSY